MKSQIALSSSTIRIRTLGTSIGKARSYSLQNPLGRGCSDTLMGPWGYHNTGFLFMRSEQQQLTFTGVISVLWERTAVRSFEALAALAAGRLALAAKMEAACV